MITQPAPSCLYEARLTHVRRAPIEHRFRYPLFLFHLDLAELPALAARLRLFSHNRKNLFALWDRDYAHASGWGLERALVAFLHDHGVLPGDHAPGWRFTLLTHVRTFGYVFNPVVFFFCHDPSGRLAAVVAEVRNTFGKVHRFLLDHRCTLPDSPHSYRAAKLLHVSPFFGLDLAWHFHFRALADKLHIAMDALPLTGGAPVFHAGLVGERHPISDVQLAAFALRYPFVTARVVAGIHGQALRLWRKGAPFRREPAYDPVSTRSLHARTAPLAHAPRNPLAHGQEPRPPRGARAPRPPA